MTNRKCNNDPICSYGVSIEEAATQYSDNKHPLFVHGLSEHKAHRQGFIDGAKFGMELVKEDLKKDFNDSFGGILSNNLILESKYQQLKNASEKLIAELNDISISCEGCGHHADVAIAQYKNEITETNKKEK